jgi:hypothetical protein
LARSGVTTPIPTVRCFQIRLSVSRVSYSSTSPGKTLGEVLDEVEQRALRFSFSASTSACVFQRTAFVVARHLPGQVPIDAAGR